MSDELHARADGHRDSVQCREALERLSEFLDSEMAPSDGDRIREHLADCEPCLTEYDLEDHIKSLVRRSCCESAPTELHLRIRSQLETLRGQLP